ncbi:MAG: hypothetical protein CUN56_06360 [Phototrophicales bacterium]|nr:MAG: hypothetical protein CUN56_06360 [Phototrophicales bacterium]RMG70595.1 MAG: hypothetical protein D6711_16930 [Chloroflexota bacterium]
MVSSKTVTAYQLLYSRVEASAFSDISHVDIRRSGFQVVYHAPEIAGDVAEIERRIQCFQPKRTNKNAFRLQFFTTSSGNVVVSHSVGIDAHPEITDPSQRPGAFIAHCLVFKSSEFNRLGNNPFVIWDGETNFIDDPVTMREIVRNNESSIVVKLGRTRQRQTKVANAELNQLVTLARRGLDGQTIAFIGENELDIENLMENIIYLTPRDERLKLSFDTIIDGCSPIPGMYFAVGTNQRVSNSKFINIDIDNPQITVSVSDSKETGYSNWLRQSLANESLETTRTYAPQVQLIDAAFEAGKLLNGELDPVAVEGFLQVNKAFILKRFQDVFSTHFSASIVDALMLDLDNDRLEYISDNIIISIASEQNLTPFYNIVAQEIYAIIVRHGLGKLKDKDLSAIQEIGTATGYLPLQTVAMLHDLQKWSVVSTFQSIVGQSTEEKRRVEVVNALVSDHNMDIVKIMNDLKGFKWGHPRYFVAKSSIHAIVDFLAQDETLNEKEIFNMIVSIINAGGGTELDSLVGKVEGLSDKQIKQISKTISKSDAKVGKLFQKMIDDRSGQS